MGYGSGGHVVEVLIEVLDEHDVVKPVTKRRILQPVIKAQQDQDWDTEDEVLNAHRDRPWVVKAFADCDVFLMSDPRHPEHGL